jgi:hypothetical protein
MVLLIPVTVLVVEYYNYSTCTGNYTADCVLLVQVLVPELVLVFMTIPVYMDKEPSQASLVLPYWYCLSTGSTSTGVVRPYDY